jgi:hypothetical protein
MERASGAIRRCAVYTRSPPKALVQHQCPSEEGLEQDFNSLHAQREACEASSRASRAKAGDLARRPMMMAVSPAGPWSGLRCSGCSQTSVSRALVRGSTTEGQRGWWVPGPELERCRDRCAEHSEDKQTILEALQGAEMGDTDVNQVFTSEAEWRESLLSRELLSAAAVLGPEFALAILARVFGLAGRELFDAIDEAEQAGLLEKDPDH